MRRRSQWFTLLVLLALGALWRDDSAAQAQDPRPTVKVVPGQTCDELRRTLVGPGINQPDSFPGYGGFVGFETPVRLKNGDWIVSFNAGYHFASIPNPWQNDEVRQYLIKRGFPADTPISAPTGGRAMMIRSSDEGKTWSKPQTIVDTEGNDFYPGILELPNGTLLCVFTKTFANKDLDSAAKSALPSRVYTVLSRDGGRSWEPKPRPVSTPYLSEEAPGPPVLLRDGSVLLTVLGVADAGGAREVGLFLSKDGGQTWRAMASVKGMGHPDGVHTTQLPDGRLIMLGAPNGVISWSADQGCTWTPPVSFGMPMFSPSLSVLRDGTLLCLHGVTGYWAWGLRAIFSRDGGLTWSAPSESFGFLIDRAAGYGRVMELPDGSLFAAYTSRFGYEAYEATKNAIWAMRFRVQPNGKGIELLRPPGD